MYTDGHEANGAACLRKKGGPSSDPCGLWGSVQLLSAISRTEGERLGEFRDFRT